MIASVFSASARRTGAGLLACWLLLLALAAVRPLALPDEGRYAEISRWMLVSGDWLVPRLDGLPFFHKPPLLHWLQAGAMALLGVHPWVVRLVPALAAGLMLAGLLAAARRLAGEGIARRAAWMLAASAGFLLGGQYANHDMLVAAWIASAIWCFALAFLQADAAGRPHAGWARAGFAACALGVMTKGLIGLLLPGLVLLLWIGATRRWRQLPRLPWAGGLALFAAIAVPWFVLAAQRYPGLWAYQFGVQQFGRFTGRSFNNPEPWWFHLAVLALLMFPWSFLLPFGRPVAVAKVHAAIRNIANETILLCWIWLLALLLFFSIPHSKLIGYILPTLPPTALLAAAGWERLAAGRPRAARAFPAAVALALAGSVAFSFGFARHVNDKLSGAAARALACRAAPGEPVYLAPGTGYPHDLPFIAQTDAPLRVVQDWPRLRGQVRDDWRRELLDAAAFEPAQAAALLLTPPALAAAANLPRRWLLTSPPGPRETHPLPPPPPGWRRVWQDAQWTLWQSAPEGPEAAQHERLPGCDDEGDDQRRP